MTKMFSKNRLTIIAEIGSNHNGSLDEALELIEIAAECGADVAKFQGFKTDELINVEHPYYDRMKSLEVPESWYPKLKSHCEKVGLSFLCTATNEDTFLILQKLNVKAFKVASGNVNHTPIIEGLVENETPNHSFNWAGLPRRIRRNLWNV